MKLYSTKKVFMRNYMMNISRVVEGKLLNNTVAIYSMLYNSPTEAL